jgi:hypothetical protein
MFSSENSHGSQPDEAAPYISVVVTARNDDHGGNLLGRMQVFVDAWISQARRHGLSSELIIVEWNPPRDRARLMNALRWPKETGPCRVRIIEVPPEVHATYPHAEALPLYQMIAKNVGIRRARGQFILATNIDIVFSDEVVEFLASRRLTTGRMYRIDRTDVGSDVPQQGTIEEQLAYCRSHQIRVCAREGFFALTPDGFRHKEAEDISGKGSGIHFGAGFFAVEQYVPGEPFRWIDNDAEILCLIPEGGATMVLEVEPGPGLAALPATLMVLDRDGVGVAEWEIAERTTIHLAVPAESGGGVQRLHLRVSPGGLPLINDPRILNLRVYRCDWVDGSQLVARRSARAALGRRPTTSAAIAERPARLPAETVSSPSWPSLVVDSRPAAINWPDTLMSCQPEIAAMGKPVCLHIMTCGDFTLMTREHWFQVRGYAEIEQFSMNIDSMLCYAAHHSGAREELLLDPMRIYHIEHSVGSGWTPEGSAQLDARIARKGIPSVSWENLVWLIAQMRGLQAPVLTNLDDWGLASRDFNESVLACSFTASDPL